METKTTGKVIIDDSLSNGGSQSIMQTSSFSESGERSMETRIPKDIDPWNLIKHQAVNAAMETEDSQSEKEVQHNAEDHINDTREVLESLGWRFMKNSKIIALVGTAIVSTAIITTLINKRIRKK